MSHRNKLTLLSASILSATLTMSVPVMAETLTEAVKKTLSSNPTILAESNLSRSIDSTIDQARSGYYPKVDLNLGIGREKSDSPTTRPDHDKWLTRGESSITASQMLFDGFATKNSVDQTQSLAESAGFSVTDTSETTSLSAIKSYLDVLRSQQLLSLTEDNLERHEEINFKIKLRSDSGVGTTSDVKQATGRLSLAKANLIANTGNLTDAETNYIHVIGHQPDSLQEPSEDCCKNMPATLNDAVSIAYQQHPAIRSSLADHEAALAQQSGAHAPMQPSVNLELSATANNDLDGVDGHNNDAQAMFRLRYNLLNGGADKARIEETQFLSENVKETINITKREIENDVRLAWSSLESTTSRLQYLEMHVKSSENTRSAYQQQFNLGQRTLLDLLDTENEVLTAKIDYTNTYYDQMYACYWLTETMGKLLESLEIEAPEQALAISTP